MAQLFEHLVHRALVVPARAVLDPAARVYWPFLLSAFALALWCGRRGGLGDALGRLLDRQIWWHPSARADYRYVAVKGALLGLLAPGGIAASVLVAAGVSTLLLVSVGPAPRWAWSGWTLAAFSCATFVADDLGRYWIHRVMHRVPWLWELHQVHHSARVLTPLTLYRTHPAEALLNGAVSALCVGVVSGLFFYLYGPSLTGWHILGVNALGFAFNAAGANLRHSHVWLSWGRWVEHLVISPAQHQLHHSVERAEQDSNFGSCLALWDLVFGTLTLAAGRATPPRFGLGAPANHSERVASMLVHPLAAATRRLLGRPHRAAR